MKKDDAVKDILGSTSLKERFLRYVKVYTESDPESDTFPSADREKDLGVMLVKELMDLGLNDAEMDDNGYVYASLKSNCGSKKNVAFLAHMDTAPDCSGLNVKPQIHENYNGEKIVIGNGIEIDPESSPELKDCMGETVVTSDGTTLLGADDKAGVAAIMSFLEYTIKHPEIEHPNVKICFTPDEEIGKGVDFINLDKVGADFGITVDGGFPNEINFENFNAFSAEVTFKGVNYHPGYAKNKMVNAIRWASRFIEMMPAKRSPENTSEREPFIHPVGMKGDVNETTVAMILRSFSMKDMDVNKSIVNSAADYLRSSVPDLNVEVKISESYLNMYEVIKENEYIMDIMKKAIENLGCTPDILPIRGGTDGARLSYMGLPCPNIFAGGVNFHSIREWVTFENIAKASAYLVEIAKVAV